MATPHLIYVFVLEKKHWEDSKGNLWTPHGIPSETLLRTLVRNILKEISWNKNQRKTLKEVGEDSPREILREDSKGNLWTHDGTPSEKSSGEDSPGKSLDSPWNSLRDSPEF